MNLLLSSKLQRLKLKFKIEPSGQLWYSEENVLHSTDVSVPFLMSYLKWYRPAIGQYSFRIAIPPISFVPIEETIKYKIY